MAPDVVTARTCNGLCTLNADTVAFVPTLVSICTRAKRRQPVYFEIVSDVPFGAMQDTVKPIPIPKLLKIV
jgi:hypothetical protein